VAIASPYFDYDKVDGHKILANLKALKDPVAKYESGLLSQ
jgi:hypothetical protein